MSLPIFLWMRNTTDISESMTKALCTFLHCMWIFFNCVVRSNIVSRHYVRNDTFTDKFLNVNPTMTDTVVSLAECLSLCSVHDSCFGYHVTKSVCNVYKSCHQNDQCWWNWLDVLQGRNEWVKTIHLSIFPWNKKNPVCHIHICTEIYHNDYFKNLT